MTLSASKLGEGAEVAKFKQLIDRHAELQQLREYARGVKDTREEKKYTDEIANLQKLREQAHENQNEQQEKKYLNKIAHLEKSKQQAIAKQKNRKRDEKLEKKYTVEINALLKTGKDIMLKDFAKLQAAGKTDRVVDTLQESGLFVKVIDNDVKEQESTHLGFAFRAIIDAQHNRWTKPQDTTYDRTTIYRLVTPEIITRTVEKERGATDDPTPLAKKTSYTIVYNITMNNILFAKYNHVIALLVDPNLVYKSPNYRFPLNMATINMWWIKRTSGWSTAVKDNTKIEMKDFKNPTEQELKDYQTQQMIRGEPAVQNEALIKVPLIAVLGFMVKFLIENNKYVNKLGARLGVLYAKTIFVKYCLETYPQLKDFWKHYPMYFFDPYTKPINDLTVLNSTPDAYIGIKKYSLQQQVKDIKEGYRPNKPISNRYIEKLRTAVPPNRYPNAYLPSVRLAIAREEKEQKILKDEKLLLAVKEEYPDFPLSLEQKAILDKLDISNALIKADFNTNFFATSSKQQFYALHDKEIFSAFINYYETQQQDFKHSLLNIMHAETSPMNRGYLLLTLATWGQQDLVLWCIRRLKAVDLSVQLIECGNGFLHFAVQASTPNLALISELTLGNASFAVNNREETPVDLAFTQKKMDIIRFWVGKQQQLSNTLLNRILSYSIRQGQLDIIQTIIDSNRATLFLSKEDQQSLLELEINLLASVFGISLQQTIAKLIAERNYDFFTTFFTNYKKLISEDTSAEIFAAFIEKLKYSEAQFILGKKLNLSKSVYAIRAMKKLIKQKPVPGRDQLIQSLVTYGPCFEIKSPNKNNLNALLRQNEFQLFENIIKENLHKFSNELLLKYVLYLFNNQQYDLACFILENRPMVTDQHDDAIFSQFLKNNQQKKPSTSSWLPTLFYVESKEADPRLPRIIAAVDKIGIHSVSFLLQNRGTWVLLEELLTQYPEKFEQDINQILLNCATEQAYAACISLLDNRKEFNDMTILTEVMHIIYHRHINIRDKNKNSLIAELFKRGIDIWKQINFTTFSLIEFILEKDDQETLLLALELENKQSEPDSRYAELAKKRIQEAKEISDVLKIVNQFERKEFDFLRKIPSDVSESNLINLYQGKDVSLTWIKIIMTAKEAIIKLATTANSIKEESTVIEFLKRQVIEENPTTFVLPNDYLQQYQALCKMKSPAPSSIVIE